MPPCLTLSIIRYGSRVKWSNPGKEVAPSPTPWCIKLSKREPSGHPRLWSPTLLLFAYFIGPSWNYSQLRIYWIKYCLIYIYIYIYIYWQHFFIDMYLIEHNRHFFCLHIFLLILSNCRIDLTDIRRESIDKPSIISYFPSTFCPTLGHHQERMYNKSDVTFVCTLLLWKKTVCTIVLCNVYFSNLFLLTASVAKDI